MLDHGTCYKFIAKYLGPDEWRVCQGRPYGENCNPASPGFLWQKEIPAFRATPWAIKRLGQAF